MKAYTDLNQSKRLAEILPLESADMRYHTISLYNLYPCDEIVYTIDFGKPSDIDIPCWSLAALYSVLPTFTIDSSDDHYFRIHCQQKFSEWYNNPIDAAFEMMCWLLENKKV